jgi:microcystin-dependent protein
MATPGTAVPGTVVASGSLTTPGGAQGVQGIQGPPGSGGGGGISADANNKATLGTDSLILVQGVAAGTSATTHTQTVSGDDPQLTNARTPTAHEASHVSGTDQIPNASATARGLLAQLSGNVTDYVGGDNACHNLVAALASVLVPTGTVIDWAGSGTAPSGWLTCDGSAVSRTTYAALLTAIGTTYGTGDGSTTFNLPDARGRTAIGVGQGAGLANRVLAAKGGEETHILSVGELAAHAHTASQATTTATQGTHTHTDSGHTHGIPQINQTGNIGTSSPTSQPVLYNGAQGGSSLFCNTTVSAAATISTVSAGAITVTNGAITVANNGSGTAHNTMSPFIALNKLIKT